MYTSQYTRTSWWLSLLAIVLVWGGVVASAWGLDSEEITNISVYEKVAPAVVTITVSTAEGPSSGAGAIIDPSGIILTSSHVIGESTTAKVALESGEEYTAMVLARVGNRSDLAILKAKADKPLPFVPLGDSSRVKVGQKVLAIGNPYGFERTLTTGIVSRLDRDRDRIQTDASINPGNSGGPLLDTQGDVIGINQSIFNPDGRRTNIGIGFAVPINTAKSFIKELALLPQPSHQATAFSVEYYPAKPEHNIPVQLKEFFK